MKKKDEVLRILKELKSHLKQQFKIKALWAFGSIVRGEETQVSDIDILVDFAEGADLLNLTALGLFLEEKLRSKVDIVPKRALREELKNNILRECIAV